MLSLKFQETENHIIYLCVLLYDNFNYCKLREREWITLDQKIPKKCSTWFQSNERPWLIFTMCNLTIFLNKHFQLTTFYIGRSIPVTYHIIHPFAFLNLICLNNRKVKRSSSVFLQITTVFSVNKSRDLF